jgi:hypothetical protein
VELSAGGAAFLEGSEAAALDVADVPLVSYRGGNPEVRSGCRIDDVEKEEELLWVAAKLGP